MAVALLALSACAGGPPAPVPAAAPPLQVSAEDRPFLLDPLAGYALSVDPQRAQELRETFQLLLAGGSRAEQLARRVEPLRLEDPGFAPAVLLGAQLLAAEGRCAPALGDLRPLVAALPDYLAARLLAARCEELEGDLLVAYQAYRELGASQEAAAERVIALQPRALEVVANRLADALRQGEPEVARQELERLETWAPDADVTLEGRWRMASVAGDAAAELAVVRQLQERFPDDLGLLERGAELELEIGDPTTAMQLLRRLTELHPEDVRLAELLDLARFRWRVAMAPPEVGQLAERPRLSRADFALLLYSLMPGVRSDRAEGARIASDILEHPHQEQIAQVINLGLMSVDETVHRFGPQRPVSRQDALRGLLAALGRHSQPPACMGAEPRGELARQGPCALAVACQLLASEDECQPRAEVSGAEALELLRRCLRLLG